jgi:tyrosine-protein kinase Etk/Wzc
MKPGLFEVLNEQVPVEMAIRATGHGDLHILATGNGERASSDVLLRQRADRLLKELSQKFSHIIIDSAPVLATDDAACLGRYTDGVFLVIRASYTPSRMAEEAVRRLLRRQINILGTIYNCAAPSSEYYSYYTRDYHGREARPPKSQAGTSGHQPLGNAASVEPEG